MIRGLNSEWVCPEMIVVGIPNTDRTRDLSPTHIGSFQFADFFDSTSFKNSGGGEKFISFIEKELMPHIDSIYPTAPYRLLFGHSMGGLFVMNTLVNHTNLFKAYVAVDPAMNWDNQKLLKEAEQALTNNTYSGISLFLAISNSMKTGMDTIKVKKDITKETEYIRSCFELRDYLNSNRQSQLNYKYKYYDNDNHHSVLMIAEYDALRFFFNCLHFHFFDFNDYKNIENQYEVLSKCFGYEVRPPESLVNGIANNYLSFKKFDITLYLFQLNIRNYPESYNVYNSMGNYYSAKGDKFNAIENYIKALSIKEVPAIRKKLESLQGK
jgi:hypothetical protein